MINKLGVCWGWRLGLMSCCLVWPIIFCGLVEAQSIREDATLGAESSRVIRNVRIRGRDNIERDSDRIDGGARRGANLFHSFEQFDVLEGRGAYFSNPDGIRNILSRVTGVDRSEIFGVLGVLGDANLFFLNPNGIVFGPNSSLDIGGSFLATTADGIGLGDQGLFSATAPEQSNLLDVNPGALFFNQVNAQSGVINSAGTLAVGQDLTLVGQNLDLQGQLLAGGNLTLQAKDTLRIRDTVTNPFVAASGGQMLVQGDRAVDIFALNHPNSGLVSSGDMVLRSVNQVGGDAHYWSGGTFRISGLSNQSTSFTSVYGPIVSSVGDIEIFGDYSGASLVVDSQGNIRFRGNITIDRADTSLTLSSTDSDMQLARQVPALIIRSGRNSLIFSSSTLPTMVNGATVQTSSNIPEGIILEGNVAINCGTVILDASLGDIKTRDIITGPINFSGDRGPILITANGNITTGNLISAAIVRSPANISGNAGAIQLSTSNGNVTTDDIDSGFGSRGGVGRAASTTISTFNGNITTGNIHSGFSTRGYESNTDEKNGPSGDITLFTRNGSIQTGDLQSGNGSNLESSGDGGAITLTAINGNITTQEIYSGSSASSLSSSNGGNITVIASGNIETGSVESSTDSLGGSSSSTISNDPGAGNGGIIRFEAGGSITTEELNSQSRSRLRNTGNGGLLALSAGSSISTAAIFTSAESLLEDAGSGGLVTLSSSTGAITIGNIITSGEAGRGDVKLTAGHGISIVTDNTPLINTSGTGTGGNITLITKIGDFSLQNGLISSNAFDQNSGGNIELEASSVALTNTDISTTSAQGSAGNIAVVASAVTLDQSRLLTALELGAVGKGGNIEVSSNSLDLDNFSSIDTATFGEGNAGQVNIRVNGSLTISNNSRIFSITSGQGNAGDVILLVRDNITLDNLSSISTATDPNAVGTGGDILITTADKLQLSNGSSLNSQTFNSSAGGDISIQVTSVELRAGGQLLTNTFSSGRAGEIFIEAEDGIALVGADLNFSNRFIPLPLILAESPVPVLEQIENGSIQQAQSLDSLFAVDSDPIDINHDILSSTRIPYVSINSEPSTQASSDYYSFTISTIGTRGIFDVDGGIELDNEGTLRGTNTSLTLLDNQGVPLPNGFSEKASTSLGAEGSIGEEPYLHFVFTKPGLYYVQIDRNNSRSSPADYNLQISLDIPNIEGNLSSISPSSGLFARTEGSRAAGNIKLNTPQLSIQDGAQINASTAIGSSGRGGSIIVNAPARINLSGNSELSVETNGAGRAGDVTLTTNTLNVDQAARITATATSNATTTEQGGSITLNANQMNLAGTVGVFSETQSVTPAGTLTLRPADNQSNLDINLQGGAQISASTIGSGQGGNLILTAPNAITIRGNGQLAVEARGRGNAGNVNITANTLTLADGASISATATETAAATAQGGNLHLNVDHLNLSGTNTGIFAATRGAAPAGELRITPNQGQSLIVNLDNGSTLSTATFSSGQGGNLIVTAPDSVTLQGNGQLSAASTNSGDAGNLTVNANKLTLQEGSQITASTSGSGNAGNVTIQVLEQVSLNRSSIATDVGITGTAQGGDIDIRTDSLNLNHSQITSSTFGQGNTGNIAVQARDRISLTNNSNIASTVNPQAIGDSQQITVQTPQLSLKNSEISASTSGQGDAGNIRIRDAETVSLDDQSQITTTVNSGAIGSGGDITLQTETLELDNRSRISSSTAGQGDTGEISIDATDSIRLRDRSQITSEVQTGATGDSQQITIRTPDLSLRGDSTISAATNGTGRAGDVRVLEADRISLSNSTISTEVGKDATVPDGSNREAAFNSRSRSNTTPQSNITINTRSLDLDNNARITASTRGQGSAGDITVNADTVNLDNGSRLTTSTSSDRSAGNILLNAQDTTEINGDDSGIFANTTANGNGGSITVNTETLNLNDRARISARSTGRGEAGDVRINTQTLNATNSTLETAAQRSSGGTIQINPNQRNGRITLNNSTITTNSGDQGGNISLGAEQIILRGDSDITTSSGGDGGNIDVTAASIIAFDDSDILANSRDARGGNITLDTPAFFGSGYVPDQTSDSSALDGNGRVDINASGSTASGTITTPDTSFIQNSLSDLPDNSIDTDQLLANSCIVRDRDQPQGQFIITGADGLPDRPGSVTLPDFPTGEIRNIPDVTEATERPWQLGDPVVEPQGVYRLPDGRLVMSRECD